MIADQVEVADEEIEIVSPPSKKARSQTISWNDAKVLAVITQAFISKPYAAKKLASGYEITAAILNKHCPEFETIQIKANYSNRVLM